MKRFLKKGSSSESGTLWNLKTLLNRGAINGDVKSGKFEAHWEFLKLVGEALLVEQLMEFLGMPDANSMPTRHIPADIESMPTEEQQVIIDKVLTRFLHTYKYGYLSDEGLPKGDCLFNYCNQLCHFTLHLLNTNDLTKEGDIDRLIPTTRYDSSLFFSHNASSKYYHQALDFLLKTQHTLSPHMKIRALDSVFVNEKGGRGQCKEADLAVELSIKTKKGLAKLLKSNKTQEAMQNTCLAAEVIGQVVSNFDKFASVSTKSGSHTKASTAEDFKKVARVYRKLRPFNFTAGRHLQSFPSLAGTPCGKVDVNVMTQNNRNVLKRLFDGQEVETDEPPDVTVVILEDSDDDD